VKQTQASLNVLMVPDYRQDNPYQTLLVNAIESHGIQVHFSEGYRRVFPIFRALHAQQQKISILHLHWLEPYLRGKNQLERFIYAIKFLLDILLLRLSGIRIIWTIHNQREHEYPSLRLELWIRRVLASWSNGIIVHNFLTLQTIADSHQLEARKTHIIPHGHYRGVYGQSIDQATARTILNLPQEGLIYLHLGMLRPYKGVEQLIRVWREHLAEVSNHTLLIAGMPLDEDYHLNLNQLIDNTDNIIFQAKFIPDAEIHLFFSAADIVVLPFKGTLTSGSAILAMSYGKPIIAPRLGSIPEILGDSYTLLYDDNGVDGLWQALQKSVNCNLYQLSFQTVAACDLLDWREIGHQTAQLYQNCLPRRTKSNETGNCVKRSTMLTEIEHKIHTPMDQVGR
jgi:beta-1,4-mannosyltransferase